MCDCCAQGGTTVKTLLNQNLSSLRSKDLAEMVDLVKERCPKCINQEEDDRIEIDVDQIGPNDLEHISDFVVRCIAAYTAAV